MTSPRVAWCSPTGRSPDLLKGGKGTRFTPAAYHGDFAISILVQSRVRAEIGHEAPLSLRLHVITEQQILIAQVERAVGDDGPGPDFTLPAGEFGLLGNLEAACFFPGFRIGFEQDSGPGGLAVEIEHAIGTDDG